MVAILRPQEVSMRVGCWLFAAGLIVLSLDARAQRGPSAAYPINTASPHPPIMQFENISDGFNASRNIDPR